MKEKLTPWSLKVAEYDRKFKVIDEAQNTIVAREMMQKDIKREFMSGLTKLDDIMEKMEIIIHGMMADDGKVEMDLVNLGTHDARTTQCDQNANNDMSYDDVCVCAIAWKEYKAGKGAGKKGPNGAGTWYRGKEVDE